MINTQATVTELVMEIANCTQAIKAFRIGCKHLAPDDLADAPSISWLMMQQDACRAQLERIRKPDYAAKLALFLVDKVGTIFGTWSGKLTATEQRDLFGRFIGKGQIVIDGEQETLCNRVKVCFGLDYDDRNVTRWRDL